MRLPGQSVMSFLASSCASLLVSRTGLDQWFLRWFHNPANFAKIVPNKGPAAWGSGREGRERAAGPILDHLFTFSVASLPSPMPSS